MKEEKAIFADNMDLSSNFIGSRMHLFPIGLQLLGDRFLDDIRKLHDYDKYWIKSPKDKFDRLSEDGEVFVNRLAVTYILNVNDWEQFVSDFNKFNKMIKRKKKIKC
jgi:hypothetical protein